MTRRWVKVVGSVDIEISFIYQGVQYSTMNITASTISLHVEIRIQVSICMLE